jgi:hypothetical protein
MSMLEQPPVLQTTDDWLRYYAECGLPAQPFDDQLVLRTGNVASLNMPAPLGERVRTRMRMWLFSGPILALPSHRTGQRRWAFLAWPNSSPRAEAFAELQAVGANLCAPGSPLLLPTSATGLMFPEWINPPETYRELPPLTTLVCAVRELRRERLMK